MELVIFCDGGGGGSNDKPFACAAVLFRDGQEVHRVSRRLGCGITNNVAEWEGLILGLEYALELGASRALFNMDSRLVVEQALGNWRIKQQHLAPLSQRAQELAAKFDSVSIRHVPRERNRIADDLCNTAIEQQLAAEEAVSESSHASLT